MRCQKALRITITISLVFLILGLEGLVAQNESGRRNINKEMFQRSRYWYDHYLYETRYPILGSLPPVDDAMPTDIRASYMYMESIARFADADFAETTLNSWRYERVMNDVLRVMAQHIYRLMDYDPSRFIQYMDEVNVRTGIRYTASIRTIFSQISNTIAEALPSTRGRDALVALCESSVLYEGGDLNSQRKATVCRKTTVGIQATEMETWSHNKHLQKLGSRVRKLDLAQNLLVNFQDCCSRDGSIWTVLYSK